jgi:hypothetical protein
MKDSGTFDPFAVMQRAFSPTSALNEAARQNTESFWDAQDKFLKSMEEYANGWFERRHVGTNEALAATRQMCEAATPFDAMREYQKWAIGSFERAMQDGLACQKHLADMNRLGAQPFEKAAESVRAEAASTESAQKQSARARAA